MLEEFFVDNYKSLINVTFCPRPENLLLGKNNAGKTNLCLALQFLSKTALLPLDDCADQVAGSRDGIANFYFEKNTVDFQVKASVPFSDESLHYEYRLEIKLPTSAMSVPSLEVVTESLRVTGAGFDDVLLLENTSAGVQLLHEPDHLDGRKNYVQTTAPRDATMLHRLYDLKTNNRANHFKNYLMSWRYYSLSPAALRGPDRRPNETVLNSDGSNLIAVLYHLKTSNERRYRRVLEYVRRIDPRIDLVNFVVGSEDKVFMVFEDKAGHRLPASHASNGTLCFLALSYALLAQPSTLVSPVLMIEEPENSIYVGFLKDLLEMAEESPGGPQLLFTTHSPYFIDLFDDRLDCIFIIRGGEEHSALKELDPEKAKQRLEMYPLGEQHFREMLA
ncbi:MAG: ATP-binding protein [Planctomycetia bacterium]|nr:ATP-binding protein [Planctomycetia bacterium]